ncbi:MAG: hypothetical protein ACI4L9_05780 [Candidatus Coproplasma sp.]
MAKGGSKLVTGIIAFLLGFLFAIIVEVGVIVGAGYYVLNTDINNLFGLFGLENSDDQNRQYINTDTENNGVKNVLELYNRVSVMVGSIGTVTLGQIEELFPAFDGLTDSLYSALAAYVDISEDQFDTVEFMNLPTEIGNLVMEIRPGALMRSMGMGDVLDGNALIGALLEGVEAEYVYADSSDKFNSVKYPLYYDEYVQVDDAFFRTREGKETGNNAYPHGVNTGWLTDTGSDNENGKRIYRQYFYETTDAYGNKVYVVTKEDGEEYVYTNPENVNSTNIYLKEYGDDAMYFSGNYYYDNDGNEVSVKPVTIGSMSEDALAPLEMLLVTDVLGDDELLAELFGDTTVSEFLEGVSISEKVDNLRLAAVIDIKIDDPILLYLGYRVTDAQDNGNGTFSGVYDGENGKQDVLITVDGGIVDTVTIKDGGEEVTGVIVSEIGDVIGNITTSLTIGDMMDISPDNMIMSYLAYGISNVQVVTGNRYTHTASYEKSDGSMGTAYVYTRIKNGESVIDYVIMDTPDGERMPCTTVDKVGDMVDGLKITSIMQVQADNAVMCYLAYGLTDMVKVDAVTYIGKVEGESVTVNVDSEGNVASVVKGDGSYVSGTSIDDISTRLENITKDLSLVDVMDIDADNNIMMYIAYGLTSVEKVSETSTNAVFKAMNGSETVYISTEVTGDGYQILGIYSDSDCTVVNYNVKGTKIDQVGDKVGTLSKDLTVGDVIDPGDDELLNAIADYKLDELTDAVNALGLDIFIKDIAPDDAILMYLTYGVSGIEKITEADFTGNTIIDGVQTTVYIKAENKEGKMVVTGVYSDAACTQKIDATTVDGVSDRISGLTETLTIGEIIDIDEGNKVLNLVKDSTISDLDTTIANVSIQRLYVDEIYEKDENDKVVVYAHDSSNYSEEYVYYTDYECTELAGENGKLTASNVEDGKTYYTHGQTTGIWRMLLKDGGLEKVCTINDFSSMMTTATNNIKDGTLGDLKDAGIIDMTDADLERYFSGHKLRDLKLSELITLVINASTSAA